MTQVFISYSRKDLVFVERLAKDLIDAGLEVWFDLSGLEVGTRWGKEIQNAIQQSQYILVVLSPNSIESEWVEKEFLYANNLKIKIIPLLYSPCSLPMWFVNLHYIDMQGEKYPIHFPELLKVLDTQPQKAKGKVEAIPVLPLPKEPEEEQQHTHQAIKQGNKVTTVSHQKTGFRSAWVILPILLSSVIAFMIWGIPTLTDKLTSTSVSTMTMTGTYTLSTSPVDGMTMVYVPEGMFIMGSDVSMDEQPVHNVTLDAFWMDQTEVTNSMYAKCVQAGDCEAPKQSYSSSRSGYFGNSEFAQFPVIFVTWSMADAYCAWAGRRLPTEAEWEKAAAGTDTRIYPWGNNPPETTLLNYHGNIGDTTAVGTYPAGASPYGAYDMAGNVAEWVSSAFRNYPYNANDGRESSIDNQTVRGGAWEGLPLNVRTANRDQLGYYGAQNNLGFRCALSP